MREINKIVNIDDGTLLFIEPLTPEKNNEQYVINYLLNDGIKHLVDRPLKNIVFRISELYTKASIDLIYFLSQYFDELVIFKPLISDQFYSDKMLVCKNLIPNSSINIPELIAEQYVS